MELLDRYVYDVGKRLPIKQREDIEKELKSLLMDALDARNGGGTPTDEDVAAVIKDFGAPADVAMRYAGEKYLIGPRLYPTYRMVLLIVLGATAFGLFISGFIGYLFEPSAASLGNHLLQLAGSLVSALWGAIGIVTVIFWGIERGIERQGKKIPGADEPWDPKSLPPVPKNKDVWKPSESIVAIVFIIIAFIVFNAFPSLIGMYNPGGDGQWQHVQILSPEALAAYLPLWNIGWALSLALHAMLLAQGRWSLGTRMANIGIQLFSIAVVVVMMTGPALLNTELTFVGDAMKVLHTVMPILNMQFTWIFIIVIIACTVDMGKNVYRIIKDRV